MDAFFASVEQHDHPELRGKPVVVGAPPDQRGVVSAASYEARRFGIHSAMPSREAAARCPQAVFVPVNGRRYEEVSRQVFHILRRFTPLVEPVSVDEAYLDVTGVRRLHGDGPHIARMIKDAIRGETGLTASVGVASNKFLAKIASDLEKPDGLTVVPEGGEAVRAFLAPLAVGRIWGVGKVTRRVLGDHGIRTIADVQAATHGRLAQILGERGAADIAALARGEAPAELTLDAERKQISREYTFPRDCSDREAVEAVLLDLVEDVGAQLREAGKYASVAHLKLRWKGFETLTRQRSLGKAVCDDFSLREAAQGLFGAQELIKPVRLIGFGVDGLETAPREQLGLFGEDGRRRERREQVSRAVDAIRRRFGERSIGRGRRTTG